MSRPFSWYQFGKNLLFLLFDFWCYKITIVSGPGTKAFSRESPPYTKIQFVMNYLFVLPYLKFLGHYLGVQGGGADADGVMAGGGGFGIQDDHHELTHFPSLECVFLPETRGLASAPFGIGFGCWRVHGRLCHACR